MRLCTAPTCAPCAHSTEIPVITPDSIWKKLPGMLQRAVAYGLMAGLAMAIVVFAFLSFGPLTEYVKNRLGVPDRLDVANVANQVQERTEDEVNSAIAFTAGHLIDSAQQRMREENDSLFQVVSTKLIEPGINRLRSLEKNVMYLNGLLNVSNELLTQQTNVNRLNADRLGELQQHLTANGTEAKLDAIISMLESQQQEINQMKRARKSTMKL